MKNLTKTSTKAYNSKISAYLLDCININDIEDLNAKQKIDYFFVMFEEEAGYANNLKRYPNTQDRLANYLSGAPSTISLPMYDDEIIDFAKEMHNASELTDKEAQTVIKNFYSHIAFKLLQLKAKR